jgi:O-antigen/teichoic acid export membrane protein
MINGKPLTPFIRTQFSPTYWISLLKALSSKLQFNNLVVELFNTVIARFLILGLNFVSTILITRILSVEDRGKYALITNAILVIMSFSTLGFHTTLVYKISLNPSTFSYFYYTSLVISLFSMVMLSILSICGVIGFYFPEFNSLDILFLILGSPFVLFSYFNSNLFVGINQLYYYNFFEFIKSLTLILLCCTAYFFIKNYNYYILFFLFSYISHVISAFFYFSKKGILQSISLKLKGCIRTFKEGFNYSFLSYTACNLSTILSKYLLLYLGMFWEMDASKKIELGYYAVAQNNIDILIIFPTTLSFFLLPKISVLKSMREKLLLLGRLIFITVIFLAFAVILSLTVADFFFVFLYGNVYINSVPIFQALLPTAICISLLSCISAFISGIGMHKIAIYAPLGALIFMILSSLYISRSNFDIYQIIQLQNVSYFIFLLFYSLFLIKKWKEN